MRREEFNAWFGTILNSQGRPFTESNIYFYVNAIRQLEEEGGVDVDAEFQKDEMASLYQLCTYSKKDNENNRPNPTKIKAIDHRPYGALSDIRSALNHYRKFCLSDGDYSVSVEPESESGTDEGATFGLERDMQEAMRETITQLESGLEIIDGGVERKVDSGFIDILAKDSNGAFVVIELKAGKASDSVIAQTLGYMVDIADAEGLEINQVRGIIVAKSFNKRIETAARAVPSLTLKAYTYSFDFN